MQDLRVSVIVPTHQRPGLLPRALASIAAQRRPPFEVVVVDDAPGGADETREIVALAGLSRARVVTNRRTPGAGGAWNTGAELAGGALLAFLDDDDEWLPGYLGEVVSAVAQRALDLVLVDTLKRRATGGDVPAKAAPERLTLAAFLIRNPGLHGSNLTIRKRRFAEVGGVDETLPSLIDRDLGLRLCQLPEFRYAPVHRPLVRRHLHTGPRLSTPRSRAKRDGVRRVFELHAHRMTPAERLAFRENATRLWGVDEHGRDVSEGSA